MFTSRLTYFRHQANKLYAAFSWRSEMARVWLRAWLHWQMIAKKPVLIGITGSAGKTTTKDLSHLILSAFHPVASNRGTFNDTMAIGYTILSVNRQHRFCLLEVGAFKPGALDWPMRLFKPKIGVLTVIGQDHFRAFHGMGIDGIAAEKAKLIEALPKNGVAVLNLDDPRVRGIGDRCQARIIWVGRTEGATLRLLDATSRYPQPLILKVEYQGTIHEVVTGLHGTHLALTVLCALGVALAAGLTLEQGISRLALSLPPEGRMQPVVMEDGVTFLRDDYKAPGWSLFVPLEFLSQATATRKIAVIGSISDFSGDNSSKYKQFARDIRQHADLVIFVGQNAHRALRARKDEQDQTLQGFSTMREAADYLHKTLKAGDLVLLKGSNKVDHLERLVLDRQRPISCWRERCGFDTFCGSCPRLYREVKPKETAFLGADSQKVVDETLIFPEHPSADPIVPVIVGLGNPGTQYQDTLHNIGYRVLDALAGQYEGVWQTEEAGNFCDISLNGKPVRLFKANAYMNETGPKLRQFLNHTGCPPSHCLMVYDDMDIEFGKLRFKSDGGDAGHRGIRSCLEALETHALPRLRFGVRQPGNNAQARAQVLTDFSDEAQRRLPELIDQAVAMIVEKVPALRGKDGFAGGGKTRGA